MEVDRTRPEAAREQFLTIPLWVSILVHPVRTPWPEFAEHCRRKPRVPAWPVLRRAQTLREGTRPMAMLKGGQPSRFDRTDRVPTLAAVSGRVTEAEWCSRNLPLER